MEEGALEMSWMPVDQAREAWEGNAVRWSQVASTCAPKVQLSSVWSSLERHSL